MGSVDKDIFLSNVNNSSSLPRFGMIAFTSELNRTRVHKNNTPDFLLSRLGYGSSTEFRRQCSHHPNEQNSDDNRTKSANVKAPLINCLYKF